MWLEINKTKSCQPACSDYFGEPVEGDLVNDTWFRQAQPDNFFKITEQCQPELVEGSLVDESRFRQAQPDSF